MNVAHQNSKTRKQLKRKKERNHVCFPNWHVCWIKKTEIFEFQRQKSSRTNALSKKQNPLNRIEIKRSKSFAVKFYWRFSNTKWRRKIWPNFQANDTTSRRIKLILILKDKPTVPGLDLSTERLNVISYFNARGNFMLQSIIVNKFLKPWPFIEGAQ